MAYWDVGLVRNNRVYCCHIGIMEKNMETATSQSCTYLDYSREEGNIVSRGYVGILFPHSLLRTSKLGVSALSVPSWF